MFNMHEFMEYRMQQQIAHEIYRQQIMQRIPDPFPQILPLGMHPQFMISAPRATLPGNVEAKLENNDLWQQFHKIGTEMIITKTGRRMFPSMRVSVKGLEAETQYCVLLEMLPIGDCRYKFSGSQWLPAGGAEPQSPQRIFFHPDSPATGSHWQSQTILFNKVKLTNNTMDNSGHVVLASMHKYQPRLHIIKTSDLSQLPWVPQQNYVFPETEFIAVTAYQNDRITKLKIDNNPFAKGFRETGQSKCKRKMMSSSSVSSAYSSSSSSSSSSQQDESDDYLTKSEDDRSSVSSLDLPNHQKRSRSSEAFDEQSYSHALTACYEQYLQQQQQQQLPALVQNSLTPSYVYHYTQHPLASSQFMQQHLPSMIRNPLGFSSAARLQRMPLPSSTLLSDKTVNEGTEAHHAPSNATTATTQSAASSLTSAPTRPRASQKRNNFSISAILAY